MADEAGNVEILKAAYKRWSDTKGGSVDDWMKICADNIAFGSLAQGAVPSAQYLTSYNSRDSLKSYFDGLARDWEMVSWEVEHFIAQGDRVVVVEPLRLAQQEERQDRIDAEGRRLADVRRQGGRVFRILRHGAGARGGGLSGREARR